jgi:sigma-E factor negative regulatory protein RseC
MIEEQARVLAVDGDVAWVETQRQSTCGSCAANKGCGTSVLAQVLGRRRTRVRVINPIGARVGDQVVLGIEEGALVRGSAALYGLPLLSLIAGALVADWVGPAGVNADLRAILGGTLGLAAGLWFMRRFADAARYDRRYQPVVLRRLPAPAAAAHGVITPQLR